MVTEPSLARHGMLPPEGWRIARLAVVLPLAILLLPVALIIAFISYTTFIPAYSAAMIVPELQARVLLRFYYVSGQESGRYLSIETPRGRITFQMCGFDWAHWG